MNKAATPEEVARQVKAYLKANDISMKSIQEDLGISASTLSGHLNGRKYISPAVASHLAGSTGLSFEFMCSGRGRCISEDCDALEEELAEAVSRSGWVEPGMDTEVLDNLFGDLGRDSSVTVLMKGPDGRDHFFYLYSITWLPDEKPGRRMRFGWSSAAEDRDTDGPLFEMDLSTGELPEQIRARTLRLLTSAFHDEVEMNEVGVLPYQTMSRDCDRLLFGLYETPDGMYYLHSGRGKDRFTEDKAIECAVRMLLQTCSAFHDGNAEDKRWVDCLIPLAAAKAVCAKLSEELPGSPAYTEDEIVSLLRRDISLFTAHAEKLARDIGKIREDMLGQPPFSDL